MSMLDMLYCSVNKNSTSYYENIKIDWRVTCFIVMNISLDKHKLWVIIVISTTCLTVISYFNTNWKTNIDTIYQVVTVRDYIPIYTIQRSKQRHLRIFAQHSTSYHNAKVTWLIILLMHQLPVTLNLIRWQVI